MKIVKIFRIFFTLFIILLRNHLRAFLNLFGNRLVKGFQLCYTDYSVFVREINGIYELLFEPQAEI